MGISETISRAALAWVRATADPDATEVTDFTDRTEQGGCETCESDYVVVDIQYLTPKSPYSWGRQITFKGNFADFIKELEKYDVEEKS